MLKRAVFGPLGLPVAMRRRPGKADAPLPPAHAKTTCSRSASSKATSASRGGRKSGDISSEGIRISDEPDTDDAETLSDKGDDSEGESNPFEDPQVRKALIRRAAALYAEDGKRFLQAMQKHEKHGGEEDTEEDLTLFDPQSEDSMDDVAVKRTKRRVKGTEVKLEEGSGQEDDDVTAEEGFTRGKFHCKLCPKKIFIFEADLEKHLESRVSPRSTIDCARSRLITLEEEECLVGFVKGLAPPFRFRVLLVDLRNTCFLDSTVWL